jgi:hypothetical protein
VLLETCKRKTMELILNRNQRACIFNAVSLVMYGHRRRRCQSLPRRRDVSPVVVEALDNAGASANTPHNTI